jgi:ribosomal protein S18 acetylase RimI-like enzyme
MSITVRRANVDDAALIASLNADVQAVHAEVLPWRFKPSDGRAHASEAAAFLAKPESLVFIAEVAGEPAGYVHAEIIRRPETSLVHPYEAIYIHAISVRPTYRRRGVGSALIEAVRAAGRAAGIELLTLDIWAFNDTARQFFSRQGFGAYQEKLWRRGS